MNKLSSIAAFLFALTALFIVSYLLVDIVHRAEFTNPDLIISAICCSVIATTLSKK
jgi:hypothetical protein